MTGIRIMIVLFRPVGILGSCWFGPGRPQGLCKKASLWQRASWVMRSAAWRRAGGPAPHWRARGGKRPNSDLDAAMGTDALETDALDGGEPCQYYSGVPMASRRSPVARADASGMSDRGPVDVYGVLDGQAGLRARAAGQEFHRPQGSHAVGSGGTDAGAIENLLRRLLPGQRPHRCDSD